MKIIVIQRHEGNLQGIKEGVARINAMRAEEITYTSTADDVVEMIRDGEPAFVVSGQVLGPFEDGTDLARVVKKKNPKALFFIYSTMPARNEAVDGVIPKNDGTLATGEHALLARILASDLEGITPERLKVAFPTIG